MRAPLADLRLRLALQRNTVLILRPDREKPGGRFELAPNRAVYRAHPRFFMSWATLDLRPPEPTAVSASPLPSPPSEALAALLHALGNVRSITEGSDAFLRQYLQLDAWMREFEAAGSDGLPLGRCPYPSGGIQVIGARRVDWLLHAALNAAVEALEGGDVGGMGLFAESAWAELLHERFDAAFAASPRDARPSAAAGLAGSLALLESVVAAALDAPAAELRVGALAWPPAWPVQARALRVLAAAEADPGRGPLSDALLDSLGVAAPGGGDGGVRGPLRRFLVTTVVDALMPSEFFLASLRAALVALRTAVHMLRRGARPRDLLPVPAETYDSTCCCEYEEAADTLRGLEFALLDAAALGELVYERGEGYSSAARNLSALAAQAHADRLEGLRREQRCRFETSRKAESLADAARRRSACPLSGGGAEGERGAFPSFPVPAGMPEGRGTGIVWLNVLCNTLLAANATTVDGGG